MAHRPDLTRLLLAYGEGERSALDQLLPLVYDQLRAIAHARLRGERPGHTLNTTGLVHEAYLKLVDLDHVQWQDRSHFFALAARLMRQILIDYARVRKADKRGGGVPNLPLEEALWMPVEQAERLLELDEALTHLAAEHPRAGEALGHHYFAGLSNEETAQVLGVSVPTVERDLRFGRTWLAAFFAKNRSAGRGGSPGVA
jgi:RNA polymerase sigma factor (TIGR02999 family)